MAVLWRRGNWVPRRVRTLASANPVSADRHGGLLQQGIADQVRDAVRYDSQVATPSWCRRGLGPLRKATAWTDGAQPPSVAGTRRARFRPQVRHIRSSGPTTPGSTNYR
ncbi:hypothetical protein GCM10027091_18190 [Streptomyces daliensis]